MESEKFFLQWREFEGNVRAAYKTLLSNGDFSDVTLASRDGHMVACHRLILASSSPFLANLVSSHPSITSVPLTLPISKLQLTFLLDFIYNGEVEVEKEHLYQFLSTGEKMQLKGLVKPEVGEPGADSNKKFDLGESVNAEQDSSEAPEKYELDSMIRRDGDKWSCINCGKIGHNKHNLSRHVLRHLEEGKTFPCNFCGKESRSSNGLNQHIVKRHPTGSVRPDFDQKSQEFGVALDEKDVEDAFDHKTEEKEEDSLQIDLDDAEEGDDPVENEVNDGEDGSAGQSRKETTEDFKEKIEAMIEKEGGVWRCIECNKVAEDSKARFRMKNHVQTHMQGLTVSCNFCEHVSGTSAALRNHKYKKHREMMESTKQEGKYKCGFCGKGSQSKKGRENHKYKYHKDEKRTKVLDSSVTDEEEATVEENIEVQRNIDIEEDLEAERRALEEEIRALKLGAEERARHTDLESPKPNLAAKGISPEFELLKMEKELKIETADEMVVEWEDNREDEGSNELVDFKAKIEALIEKNGEVWRCVVCGKSAEESKARDRLKNHVQIHMELTHACDVCGKTCNTKSALGQHMYKQHKDVVEEMANKRNDSKQFRCSICEMKSTTNAALEQHKIKRHKEESLAERKVKVEKSFECNVCGKFSTTKKALGAHMYKRH